MNRRNHNRRDVHAWTACPAWKPPLTSSRTTNDTLQISLLLCVWLIIVILRLFSWSESFGSGAVVLYLWDSAVATPSVFQLVMFVQAWRRGRPIKGVHYFSSGCRSLLYLVNRLSVVWSNADVKTKCRHWVETGGKIIISIVLPKLNSGWNTV